MSLFSLHNLNLSTSSIPSHIKALNKAFDPLGNSGRKSPEVVAGSDVVETSHSILQLAESLSKRLLGTYTQIRDDPTEASATACTDDKLSKAQLAAKGVCVCLTRVVFKLLN